MPRVKVIIPISKIHNHGNKLSLHHHNIYIIQALTQVHKNPNIKLSMDSLNYIQAHGAAIFYASQEVAPERLNL